MSITYSNRRYAFSLALVALLALAIVLSQLTASQLSQTMRARLEGRSYTFGCKYSIHLLALTPPDWFQQVWEVELGSPPDSFYARTYRNGYTAYAGVSVLVRGRGCL